MAENNEDGQSSGEEVKPFDITGKSIEEVAQIAADQRDRATKAEALLKAKEDAEKVAADEAKKKADADAAAKNQNNNSNPPVVPTDPVEVARLANALSGLSDAEITELTKVAKAESCTLVEAKTKPLFTAWQNAYLEDQKRIRAKKGGSNGSSQSDADDETPNFAPDIHKPEEDQRKQHMDMVAGLNKGK